MTAGMVREIRVVTTAAANDAAMIATIEACAANAAIDLRHGHHGRTGRHQPAVAETEQVGQTGARAERPNNPKPGHNRLPGPTSRPDRRARNPPAALQEKPAGAVASASKTTSVTRRVAARAT